MINKKLIHFKTKEEFLKQKDQIYDWSIVYIKDTREIWTHDSGYQTLPPDWEEDQLLEATENGPEWVNKKDIIVGNAGNLQGNNEIVSSSAYHTTGGNEDVLFGTAQIENIKGNAVAWNQLIPADKRNVTNNVSDSVSVCRLKLNDYSEGSTYKIIYEKIYELSDVNKSAKAIITITGGSKLIIAVNGHENDLNIAALYNTISGHKYYFTAYFKSCDYSTIGGIVINDVQLFDLTLIYGTGNEPSTAEQFEADYQRWFGKPLEYEEYDEGSIRSVLATGIKTVGFNQWNGDIFPSIEGKYWLDNQGNVQGEYNSGYCNTDYIRVLPNTKYYANYANGTNLSICFYDESKNFISGIRHNNATNGKIYTTPSNCAYIRDSLSVENKDKYCIHLVWSGKRNGDYEPYWEETQPLPITELTSGGQVIFHDGLKRAGDVYDEIFVENGVTKAIKRVGVKYGDDYRITDVSSYSDGHIFVNLCVYNIRTEHTIVSNLHGTQKSYYASSLATQNNIIGYCVNLEGNSFLVYAVPVGEEKNVEYKNEFLNLLKGLIVYYELTEPETYIIDNFNLPVVYKIDDFGTEQILMPENSVAPTITSRYGINAVDAIRNLSRNYVNKNGDTVTGTLNLTNDNPLNVSSTNVIKNLNADMVDGLHNGEFTAAELEFKNLSYETTLNTTGGSFVFGGKGTDNNENDWSGIQIEGYYDRFQILHETGNILKFRYDDSTKVGSGAGWGLWTEFAFMDSTVAAAKRTISTPITTTDISKVPTTSQMSVVNTSQSGTFGLANTMQTGTELQVFINNTGSSDITIAIPTTFKSNGLDSITIESGNYGEINVISDGTNLYLKAI